MLRLFIMNKSKVDEEMKYYKPDRTTRLRIMTPFSCICKAHPIILCASQDKAFRLHTYKLYNCLPLPTHYTHKLTSSALGLFRLSHHPFGIYSQTWTLWMHMPFRYLNPVEICVYMMPRDAMHTAQCTIYILFSYAHDGSNYEKTHCTCDFWQHRK